MKIINYIILILALGFLVSGCQGLKDGLSFKKKANVDEFLIKKKNPLVLPPEFTKLPTPDKDVTNRAEPTKDEIDLSKILKKKEVQKNSKSQSSSNLEKSISEILNKK